MAPGDITTPIHTAAVGVGNLRFFRSPLDGPRQPWHAVEDLYRCMAMDRGLRRHSLSMLEKQYGKDIRSIFTDKGETTIAPHFMAQGLIDSLVELGQAPANSAMSYAEGAAGAMKALTADMDPAASVNFAIAAFRNENGIDGPFDPVKFYPDGKGGGLIR